jgi:hypothetical protein
MNRLRIAARRRIAQQREQVDEARKLRHARKLEWQRGAAGREVDIALTLARAGYIIFLVLAFVAALAAVVFLIKTFWRMF